MSTRIQAELLFEFDNEIEFDEVSKYLGVYPVNHTQMFPFPDKLESFKKHKSWWYIDTEYIETVELEDVLAILMKQIEGKEELICNLLLEYKGSCILSIVPWISREQKPIFNFERNILDLVHKLNATIQFDIYYDD